MQSGGCNLTIPAAATKLFSFPLVQGSHSVSGYLQRCAPGGEMFKWSLHELWRYEWIWSLAEVLFPFRSTRPLYVQSRWVCLSFLLQKSNLLGCLCWCICMTILCKTYWNVFHTYKMTDANRDANCETVLRPHPMTALSICCQRLWISSVVI